METEIVVALLPPSGAERASDSVAPLRHFLFDVLSDLILMDCETFAALKGKKNSDAFREALGRKTSSSFPLPSRPFLPRSAGGRELHCRQTDVRSIPISPALGWRRRRQISPQGRGLDKLNNRCALHRGMPRKLARGSNPYIPRSRFRENALGRSSHHRLHAQDRHQMSERAKSGRHNRLVTIVQPL